MTCKIFGSGLRLSGQRVDSDGGRAVAKIHENAAALTRHYRHICQWPISSTIADLRF